MCWLQRARIDAVVPVTTAGATPAQAVVYESWPGSMTKPHRIRGPHDAGSTREPGIKLNPLLPTLLESIVNFGGRRDPA